MTARLRSAAGLSLVEVTIILCVMLVLTGVMAPASAGLISQARDVRVLHDCQAIRDALVTMLNDLGRTTLRVGPGKGTLVELLVSDGATPDAATAESAAWTRTVDGAVAVDLLSHHLVNNEPAAGAAPSWPLPARSGNLGWRGAYLKTGLGADPWGRRYAVNVEFLGRRPDVLVISAGSNGILETPYEATSLHFGGDDVAVLAK